MFQIFPPDFSYGNLFKLVRYDWYCFAWYLQLTYCKYWSNFGGYSVVAKVSEHILANACIDNENAFKAVFLYIALQWNKSPQGSHVKKKKCRPSDISTFPELLLQYWVNTAIKMEFQVNRAIHVF